MPLSVTFVVCNENLIPVYAVPTGVSLCLLHNVKNSQIPLSEILASNRKTECTVGTPHNSDLEVDEGVKNRSKVKRCSLAGYGEVEDLLLCAHRLPPSIPSLLQKCCGL